MRSRWSRRIKVFLVFIAWSSLVAANQDTESGQTSRYANTRKTNSIFLQPSMTESIDSHAEWTDSLTVNLTAATICYKIKVEYYRPEVTVFSFINSRNEKIRTDHNRRGMQVMIASHEFRAMTDHITPLMYWSAYCIGIDTRPDNGSFTLYVNGEKWQPENPSDLIIPGNSDKLLFEEGGTIVLGQDQDIPGGAFDASQSFCGHVTDLNVWSSKLSDDEMSNITTCKGETTPSDVLTWDDSTWKLGTDTMQNEIYIGEACDIDPLPYFMFLDQLKHETASGLCQAFGGNLSLPKNEQEQNMIFGLANESISVCGADGGALMWLGMSDEEEENTWLTVRGEEVNYFNWAAGQPNGEEGENCAVIKGGVFNGSWADHSCRKSFKVCPMCELEIPVLIRFRGICDAQLYDDRFVLAGKMNNKPYFRGYYRSEVFFNQDISRWQLKNRQFPEYFALMEESDSIDFPIGRHLWRFSHGFCGVRANVTQSLALTQCAKDEEFTCDDGTCIPINKVCDRRTQCPDLSDELDCSTVQRPKGYQPTLPPPSEEGEALPVYLNLTLKSFTEINPVHNMFTAELMVRMIWKDQRLRFKHLRRDRQLNIILPSEAENIWIPVVDFLNAENNQHTVLDDDGKITIKRLGGPLGDDIEESKEARIYEGNENYIRISRKYTITFQCDFNFFYFPFNTDYCHMIFRINKNTENYVKLEKFGPGIRYEGEGQLTEFKVGGIYMERLKSEEPYSGLDTVIQLRHLYATQIFSIFVPTTLINLISFGTIFFKWFDFQNRIMVSLTALLVLSTLFSQVSDNLPKTSYLKLIDVWFLFSIVYSFMIIIQHVLIEYFHKYNNPSEVAQFEGDGYNLSTPSSVKVEPAQKKAFAKLDKSSSYYTSKLINRVGFFVTTITYIIFFVVFWIIAFQQKIAEDSKVFEVDETDATGYPD